MLQRNGWVAGALAGLAVVAVPGLADQLTLVPTGAMARAGGYMLQRLQLVAERPPEVVRVPDGLVAPLFGLLRMGPEGAQRTFAVAVDHPEGQPQRIWVDRNGNGDLTDDPAVNWQGRKYKVQNSPELTQYSGKMAVAATWIGPDAHFSLGIYRFDPADPHPLRAPLKSTLLYYSDYGWEGQAQIGGKAYRVLLNDAQATGDFRGKPEAEVSGVFLLVDRDGDGRFDPRYERYDVRKPFALGGATFELRDLTPSGDRFSVVASQQKVVEVPVPVSLEPGRPALAFSARTMEGKAIQFPSSYKGKLVLLDFWATWCGPCIAELPHLLAAYKEFNPRGLEVLGISLDSAEDREKLLAFVKERGMAWPQVFDGGGWKAAVAVQYSVDSIPRAILVDGDTGLVVATGAALRGPNLSRTIADALQKKGLR